MYNCYQKVQYIAEKYSKLLVFKMADMAKLVELNITRKLIVLNRSE